MVDLTDRPKLTAGDLARAACGGDVLLTRDQFTRVYDDLEILALFGLLDTFRGVGLYIKED